MKINVSEVIEAPAAHVFSTLTNFAKFEHQARQHGATVHRTDDLDRYDTGTTWRAAFQYRGKNREVTLSIHEFRAPEKLRIVTLASSVEGDVRITLTPMGTAETRIDVEANVEPKTLAARLLLQSLKLAKGRIRRKFAHRVNRYIREIEESYRPGS